MVFLTHEFSDMPWLDLNELLIGRVCSSNCGKGCEIDHIRAVLLSWDNRGCFSGCGGNILLKVFYRSPIFMHIILAIWCSSIFFIDPYIESSFQIRINTCQFPFNF